MHRPCRFVLLGNWQTKRLSHAMHRSSKAKQSMDHRNVMSSDTGDDLRTLAGPVCRSFSPSSSHPTAPFGYRLLMLSPPCTDRLALRERQGCAANRAELRGGWRKLLASWGRPVGAPPLRDRRRIALCFATSHEHGQHFVVLCSQPMLSIYACPLMCGPCHHLRFCAPLPRE